VDWNPLGRQGQVALSYGNCNKPTSWNLGNFFSLDERLLPPEGFCSVKLVFVLVQVQPLTSEKH
jgi:hypothetical protein